MKIRQILSQSRRDFTAEYVCEHCGHMERGYGYDDDYFHRNVIPQKKCGDCGLTAGAGYPRGSGGLDANGLGEQIDPVRQSIDEE